MSTVSSDRAACATGYANDVRAGMYLLRRGREERSLDASAQRRRAALQRAVAGVLTYSTDRDELDLAIGALEELEQARHRRRLTRDVTALRGHGATIPAAAVDELVDVRTVESVKARLDDLDAARHRAGLPALPC